MTPTDIADVGGATYTHLMNGVSPNGNWTGLFNQVSAFACGSLTARR